VKKQVEEDRGESATWQHAFVALGRLKLTKLLNALFRTPKKKKNSSPPSFPKRYVGT
jgi:hypothetical protein